MTKLNSEHVDSYFQYGVDLQNRRIFMFDDVSPESIGIVIKAIYFMETESSTKPIELFIGSFGGSEYDMFALYDVIHTIKAPVHTTALGCCMSAAPILVACGAPGHRYATPNTWFMVHQSWGEWGPKRTDEMRKELDHYDAMGDRWYELMALHTGQTIDFWKRHCQKVGDAYFDAHKAQELGLIDHIWKEKC